MSFFYKKTLGRNNSKESSNALKATTTTTTTNTVGHALTSHTGERPNGGNLLTYRGAEKTVPVARAKTVRENLVTLIVDKLPKCTKVYVTIDTYVS